MKKLLSFILKIIGIIAVGLVLYLLVAACFLGVNLVSNYVDSPKENDVTIYVFADAFHADLIIPIDPLANDWWALLDTYHFQQNREAIRYLSIGWGSRSFYLGMQDWDNFDLGYGLKALALDKTLLHIAAWDGELSPQKGLFAIRISSNEFEQMKEFVHQQFLMDQEGRIQLIPDRRYWKNDAFFAAKGRYHPFRTCNQWTGEALRAAGVNVPVWSPFAYSITWSLQSMDE